MNILRKSKTALAAGCLCASLGLAAEPFYTAGQTDLARGQQPQTVAVKYAESYSGLQVIDLSDMGEMRGGFSFGGMEMTFGATLSTLIDNIKLETVFNVTAGGAEVISQVLSNIANVNDAVAALKNAVMDNLPSEPTTSAVTGPTAGLIPATGTPATGTPSALQSSVTGNPPTVVPSSRMVSPAAPVTPQPSQQEASLQQVATVPTTTAVAAVATSNVVLIGQDSALSIADLSPADVNLDGVGHSNGFSGIVVSNKKGFTAAVHKLTQDAAISAIISNASDLKVSQKLDIQINIQNLKSAREASLRSALSKLGMSR
ncbi:MAG: hypothetical protein ACJAWL_000539 [Motiliproteus sp.]|jgi:hypothetical protein